MPETHATPLPTPRAGEREQPPTTTTVAFASRARTASSPRREMLRRFRRDRTAMFGLILLLLLIAGAYLVPVLSPYSASGIGSDLLLAPNAAHWWGTDDLGRDILTASMAGLQVSLAIGALAGLIAATIGTLIGSVAGFVGGRIDSLLMRFTDFVLTIPVLVLALVVVAVMGGSQWYIATVIGSLAWPPIARLVRAQFMNLRTEAFVDAARGYAAPRRRIILSELLPNTWDIILVATAMQIPLAILIEAGISFLGAGDPDARSLGLMLRDAYGLIGLGWWAAFFPGLVLSALAVSLNMVSDGLNDAVQNND